MSAEGELWHIVEAKRDDGTPTMFRIRELEPKPELDKIFVVELPYPTTEMSRLPNATSYRRVAEFDENWLRPACTALGWEVVGHKIEDGSFFLYMYGAGEPNDLIARLSPFDGALGFYDDADPAWTEYGTLRELLDQAKSIPQLAPVSDDHLGKPAAKKSPAKRPAAKRPAAKKPPAKKPPAAKKPAAKKPAAKKPAAQKPPAKKPAKKPAAKKRR
jgi:hypothetical protein